MRVRRLLDRSASTVQKWQHASSSNASRGWKGLEMSTMSTAAWRRCARQAAPVSSLSGGRQYWRPPLKELTGAACLAHRRHAAVDIVDISRPFQPLEAFEEDACCHFCTVDAERSRSRRTRMRPFVQYDGVERREHVRQRAFRRWGLRPWREGQRWLHGVEKLLHALNSRVHAHIRYECLAGGVGRRARGHRARVPPQQECGDLHVYGTPDMTRAEHCVELGAVKCGARACV